jgi:hypothetical protein
LGHLYKQLDPTPPLSLPLTLTLRRPLKQTALSSSAVCLGHPCKQQTARFTSVTHPALPSKTNRPKPLRRLLGTPLQTVGSSSISIPIHRPLKQTALSSSAVCLGHPCKQRTARSASIAHPPLPSKTNHSKPLCRLLLYPHRSPPTALQNKSFLACLFTLALPSQGSAKPASFALLCH